MSDPILMIEDDTRLAAMVTEYLAEHGFEVTAVHEALPGIERLREGRFAAVLLDVMLPDLDGFEVCRRIRAESQVPILMLTARGDETDRIVGLELGADDYLPKPFNPRELLARLRAILRRGPALDSGEGARRPPIEVGALRLDPELREVRLSDQKCDLTQHQFDLLWVLAERAGRAVSRDALMEAVSGGSLGPFDRSIDVHISRIRAAIEDDPKKPKRILTLRGVGYMLVREDAGGDPGADGEP